MNAERTTGKQEGALLGLILALALALRLFKADAALWYDEIFTVVNFVRLPVADLIASFDSLNNHMLYSLLAKACAALLGENPLALRLPAILFGVGSIFIQWRIARRVMSPMAALGVALLLAISYHHVWFSQNARGYTGLLFFTSWATLLFVKGLERPEWKTWTGYALLVAAAMYTHMSAGFFFIAHGAVYLLMLTRRWPRAAQRRPGATTLLPIYGIALSIIVTLLLYAPIIGQAVRTIGEVSSASQAVATTSTLAEWRSPLRALREIGASISAAGPLVPFILIGAVLVLGAGIAALYRRAPVLTAIYVLHVPLATILLYLVGVRIWPRYFFVDIGFIMMALVEGVIVWSALVTGWLGLDRRWAGAGRALAVAGVALMALVSVGLLARNYAYPKQDYIAARDHVLRNAAPQDRISSVGLAAYAYGHYYAPQFASVETGAELERLRARTPGATWLLMSFPHQLLSARPDVAAELDRHFDKVATFPGTLGDGAVWVYRSRGGGG